MYYYFDLKIELYDTTGICLFKEDITGSDLQKISAIINKFPTSYSGAILAYHKDTYLDGVKLNEIKKDNYDYNSFQKWVLQTNDLAYNAEQEIEEQKESKTITLVAQGHKAGKDKAA